MTSFFLRAAWVLVPSMSLAQTVSVQHVVRWTEVDAQTSIPVSTPNMILEPGEGALLEIDVEFSPPFGGQVAPSWWTGPGNLTTYALVRTWFHLAGSNNGNEAGTWSGLELLPDWHQPASAGNPQGGWVGWIMPLQDAPFANTSNPVIGVWRGIWVPAEYTPRTVSFWTYPIAEPPFTWCCSATVALHNSEPPPEFASGYDGRWRIVASSTGESVVIFLQLDEPENRLSLHVESRICPLKFAVVTSVEQLDGLMKHLLSLCR